LWTKPTIPLLELVHGPSNGLCARARPCAWIQHTFLQINHFKDKAAHFSK